MKTGKDSGKIRIGCMIRWRGRGFVLRSFSVGELRVAGWVFWIFASLGANFLFVPYLYLSYNRKFKNPWC